MNTPRGGGGGGLFAQQEREPIRGRPAVRGKRTYGGRPGQCVEEQGTWASRTQKHSYAGYGRPVERGAWTAKTVKRPRQQPAHPEYANYWAPLTRKRHTMPHSAQPQHTNYWAPRTRKRHQQEHRPQRPTESSNPTQHAKGRTGDCPGPRKGATTRRNVTQGALRELLCAIDQKNVVRRSKAEESTRGCHRSLLYCRGQTSRATSVIGRQLPSINHQTRSVINCSRLTANRCRSTNMQSDSRTPGHVWVDEMWYTGSKAAPGEWCPPLGTFLCTLHGKGIVVSSE